MSSEPPKGLTLLESIVMVAGLFFVVGGLGAPIWMLVNDLLADQLRAPRIYLGVAAGLAIPSGLVVAICILVSRKRGTRADAA
jgi:hypothetical protein